MSVALALLSSLLWGTADFLGGTASRRLPVPSVLGVAQLIALLGLVPLAVVTGGLDEPRDYVVPGIFAGISGLVGLAAFYRALAIGTMGIVAPIAALGVAVPVVAGLLQGESPSTLQLVGIAVAVAGVVLASGPELSGEGRGGATALVLAGVAAVGFGIVFVLLAEGSGGEEGSVAAVVMTLLTMRLAQVLLLTVLLVAAAPSRGWEIGVRRRDLLVLAPIGVFDVGANGAFALASLYPVVTALLARQLHGERLRAVQYVGVAAALFGVLLIAGG